LKSNGFSLGLRLRPHSRVKPLSRISRRSSWISPIGLQRSNCDSNRRSSTPARSSCTLSSGTFTWSCTVVGTLCEPILPPLSTHPMISRFDSPSNDKSKECPRGLLIASIRYAIHFWSERILASLQDCALLGLERIDLRKSGRQNVKVDCFRVADDSLGVQPEPHPLIARYTAKWHPPTFASLQSLIPIQSFCCHISAARLSRCYAEPALRQ
jgi:hypothetical protein